MSDKFKDIYRIDSTRLQNWNYGWQGMYFVTLCTAEREHYFGKYENNKILLSEIGEIVQKEWIRTQEIRPEMNIELDAFCVMPNHFHGIIIIGENEYNRRDAMHRVSTTTKTEKQNQFAPQRKNLASVIRGFKSSVTMYARKNNIDFAWQTRFYDQIIRDNKSFIKIRQYIENNALNWHDETSFGE